MDTTLMTALINEDTGEQERDQTAGLPMWLIVGDDSGTVVLGSACQAPEVPLGLSATDDGTTAPPASGYEVLVP